MTEIEDCAGAAVVDEQELNDLGFTAAATKIKEDRALARKLRIAFEHFRVVTPENINAFNARLAAETRLDQGSNRWGQIYSYKALKFTPVALYAGAPPREVLEEIRKANALGCFDSYEVATIESVTVVPDPIVFGVINGSPNKYFVAQWDDDVKIENILKEDEG